MKFLTAATSLLFVASAAYAGDSTTVKVTFDQTYDNPNGLLSGVACSNGNNGLLNWGQYFCFTLLAVF